MKDEEGVKGDESSADSSTGTDSTSKSSSEKDKGGSEDSAALERGNEALRKERDRLLKEVSDARASRRSLNSDQAQDGGDTGGTDTSKAKPTDRSAPTSLEEAARKRAFRLFASTHPEYQDETKWKDLERIYTPRRSQVIWEDIIEDLEDAHVVLNRDAISTEAAQKAAGITARKMKEAESADIGGTSSQTNSGVSKVELTADEKAALLKLQKADPTMTEERYLKAKVRRNS